VLASADGAHKFAATLEQHERNVEEARQAGILP
jgi:cell division protein YceG involved in septum cleavage